MNYRQADWSPLGWHHDPVPGDPDVVDEHVRQFRQTAQQAHAAVDLLHKFSQSGMVSYSVDELLAESTAIAGRVAHVEARYLGAAGALGAYGPALRAARNRSWELRNQAEEILHQDQRAYAHSADLHSQIQRLPEGLARASLCVEYTASEESRSRANHEGQLRDVKELLHQVCAKRDESANDAARVIKFAVDASQLNDSLGDRIHDAFVTVDRWLQKHADSISTWGETLSWIGLGFSALGMIPPLLPLAVVGKVMTYVGAGLSVLGAYGKARKTGDWGGFWVEAGFAAATLGAGTMVGTVGRRVVPKVVQSMVRVSDRVRSRVHQVVERVPFLKNRAKQIVELSTEALRDHVVKPIVKRLVRDPKSVILPVVSPMLWMRSCAPPPCVPLPVMNCQRVYVGAAA